GAAATGRRRGIPASDAGSAGGAWQFNLADRWSKGGQEDEPHDPLSAAAGEFRQGQTGFFSDRGPSRPIAAGDGAWETACPCNSGMVSGGTGLALVLCTGAALRRPSVRPPCVTGKAVPAPLSARTPTWRRWPGTTPPAVVPLGPPRGAHRPVCEPS